MRVSVQLDDFDIGKELDLFRNGKSNTGAIVSFQGIVRNNSEKSLLNMDIEQYPGMTQKAISKYVATAVERWSLNDALVIHRHGKLFPGDQIMMVATAAMHRHDAFQSAEFLMDYLKSRAPFWKKEITKKGYHWVESVLDDEKALERW
ncbi:MAG: molybdenum cofactor biosynthesis protein MoaE [Rhodobacterales bacterium]|nr:molybdenum cofactor biosynthesis protein MoaE [Rhodobacterales bacterium]MDC3055655.1 molybdenum cofactor biosynthesis protein MoaE [Paracoccaceae bacterium]